MPDDKSEFDRGPVLRSAESMVRTVAKHTARSGSYAIDFTMFVLFKPSSAEYKREIHVVVEDCSKADNIVNALKGPVMQAVEDVINWHLLSGDNDVMGNVTSWGISTSRVK